MDLSPLFLSLKVALVATVITFVLGIAAAWMVYRLPKGKGFLDGLFTLPLVLPPTVIGFLLLLIFGKNSWIGQFLSIFELSVVFSWMGAVIASVVVSFPLMYRSALSAFLQLDQNMIYAARTLGMAESKIFFKVVLQLAMPGIMGGTILAFARALGEFGATIMLAGNIPGRTQTMAVAVYTAVQAGDRQLAFQWVGIIVAMSFAVILIMNYQSGSLKRKQAKMTALQGR